MLTLALLFACRPEGVSPLPGGVATVPLPEDSGVEAELCPGATDVDADGWQTGEVGGNDCNDNDGTVGPCSEDTGVVPDDCAETTEICNGLDDDCDGIVDDNVVLSLTVAARAVVTGPLLASEEMAVVVGIETGAADGAVEVYTAGGELVVRIEGTGQSASFGSQLATGRDLTGDGLADLVIAAPNATTADGPNSGRVFVLPGPITAETTMDSAVGWFEGGELDGQPGRELALVPDMNGDGQAELVFGYYRFVVLFSGVPAAGARLADALATVELNTGGGTWYFASIAAEEADSEPAIHSDLLLGMETYAGGQGLVARVTAPDLAVVESTSTADFPGLGAKLTVVDNVIWTLSGSTPVRLPDFATLPLQASALANGGDLDLDGTDELLVLTDEGAYLVDSTLTTRGPFPVPTALQPSRATLPPPDLDGDGTADPAFLDGTTPSILSGATLAYPCDNDGDGYSPEAGDCDDESAAFHPLAPEYCDGTDGDCDGQVDAPANLLLDFGVPPVAVALLGPEDGFWLDNDGSAYGFGKYAASSLFGLAEAGPGRGTASAITDAGDIQGSEAVYLLAHTDAAALILDPYANGEAESVAAHRLLDGTGLVRTGALGSAGDTNGDGAGEVYVVYASGQGQSTIALFSGPIAEDRNADEADTLVRLPEGWTTVVTAPVPHAGLADLDGDGRDDLAAASPVAYYGWGRISIFADLADGSHEADDVALAALFGEPGEALGTSLATGGDLDGNGIGDLLAATTAGTRVIRGGACPMFGDRRGTKASTLAVASLGSTAASSLSLVDGVLSQDSVPVRTANTLYASNGTQVAYAHGDSTFILGISCAE